MIIKHSNNCNSQGEINADYGINVDKHSKPRNKYTVFAIVQWF
jgi:hypothetical protein